MKKNILIYALFPLFGCFFCCNIQAMNNIIVETAVRNELEEHIKEQQRLYLKLGIDTNNEYVLKAAYTITERTYLSLLTLVPSEKLMPVSPLFTPSPSPLSTVSLAAAAVPAPESSPAPVELSPAQREYILFIDKAIKKAAQNAVHATLTFYTSLMTQLKESYEKGPQAAEEESFNAETWIKERSQIRTKVFEEFVENVKTGVKKFSADVQLPTGLNTDSIIDETYGKWNAEAERATALLNPAIDPQEKLESAMALASLIGTNFLLKIDQVAATIGKFAKHTLVRKRTVAATARRKLEAEAKAAKLKKAAEARARFEREEETRRRVIPLRKGFRKAPQPAPTSGSSGEHTEEHTEGGKSS